MSARFEELAWGPTPMGEISLRRRVEPTLQVDVYEVRLGDEFLMSSLFTVAEVELARRGLAQADGNGLDVVVGGLGLGCTAAAALEDGRVASVEVVEVLDEVISWHRDGLLPLSGALTGDPRCRLVQGDFFARAAAAPGTAQALPTCDAVLLDVDHTPGHVLHPSHAALYTPDGLARLAAHLRPAGVFALWSDDPPDPAFERLLSAGFATAAAHVVAFANPLTGGESANTVYVATTTPG